MGYANRAVCGGGPGGAPATGCGRGMAPLSTAACASSTGDRYWGPAPVAALAAAGASNPGGQRGGPTGRGGDGSGSVPGSVEFLGCVLPAPPLPPAEVPPDDAASLAALAMSETRGFVALGTGAAGVLNDEGGIGVGRSGIIPQIGFVGT